MLMVDVRNVSKSFTLHAQGGVTIDAMEALSFQVMAGEAVGLVGPSGAGKSSLMRMIYGNYSCSCGAVLVRAGELSGAELSGRMIDMATAAPRVVAQLRRTTLGHISQFLRVIPRVPTEDIVMAPMLARGMDAENARQRARLLLERLRVPTSLWPLSPVTFSGGEQQRVNIARSFAVSYPILLVDEPTASLDADNRATVIQMINEARSDGAAVIGIFHDDDTRRALCTRTFAMPERPPLAA